MDNLGAYLRKMAIDGYVISLDLSEVRKMGGRKFFCVFKIGSSIQLELDM